MSLQVDGEAGDQRAKGRSLWPVPGGKENYARTMRAMLEQVAAPGRSGPLNLEGLAVWLTQRHDLKGGKAAYGYAWLVVQLGFADQGEGHLVLTPRGREFLADEGGGTLAHTLLERIEGIDEVFRALYPDRSVTIRDLWTRWQTVYGWKRRWQTYYRLHWLVAAGVLREEESGVFCLTAQGKQFAERFSLTQPLPLLDEVAPTPEERGKTAPPETAPSASLGDLVRQHTDRVRKALAEALGLMSPERFERFCRDLLEELGFTDVEVTGVARDGGIDGYGLMQVGIVQVRAAFQCKRWRTQSVGRPEIDRFRGAVQGRFDQGIFVTTSSFTKDAQAPSLQPGAVTIMMVDGNQIVDMMVKSGVGVRRSPLELLELDDDFFRED